MKSNKKANNLYLWDTSNI